MNSPEALRHMEADLCARVERAVRSVIATFEADTATKVARIGMWALLRDHEGAVDFEASADVWDWPIIQCTYNTGCGWSDLECGKPRPCPDHEGEPCSRAGCPDTAVGGCSHAGRFVCGYPVCADHRHDCGRHGG